MRAILLERFGGPDVLTLGEAPEPELRNGDLLVRVRAAGVNRADLNQRNGAYGREYFGDSDLMGLEIAGEVEAAASDVSGFAIGDRVMGLVGGGAYADLARIPADMAIPIPEKLGFVEAAAIPEAFIVAHEALVELGRLKPGEVVLLHGASGGVGMASVAIAQRLGARVLFTARAASLASVVAAGADVGIDYREDFLPFALERTGGKGVDVIVDTIGTPNLERNVNALAVGGRLIQLGLMGGRAAAPLPMDRLLFRRLSIMGTVMKSRSPAEKAALTKRFSDRWLPQFQSGALAPVVAQAFDLGDAAQAHATMAAGGYVGKIVLRI